MKKLNKPVFSLNISKKDAKLLFILLGICILLVCYLTVYSPYTKKAEQTEAEIGQLRPVLTELQGHYANLSLYNAGIDNSREFIAEECEKYPTDVRSEDLIMYAIRLEEKIGLDITSIAFSDPVPALTFQSMKEDADGEEYACEMHAVQISMSITFNLTYEEFKELMDFIADTRYRTSLNNIAVSFDSESGGLTGSATIDKFFLTDGADEYSATSVPNVELGRDDLFGTVLAPEE